MTDCSPSKQKLRDAFTRHIMSRRFSDLTVGGLCADAGVARSTFYAQYPSLIAVLFDMVDPLFEDLAAGLLYNERRVDAEQVLTHFWEQRRLAELWRDPISRNGMEKQFADRFSAFGIPQAQCLFMATGSIAVIRQWIGGRIHGSTQDIYETLSLFVVNARPELGAGSQ